MTDELEKMIEKVQDEFTSVEVSVEPCLGHCGDCATEYIALANEELITGDTTHVLFERIKNHLGEQAVAR